MPIALRFNPPVDHRVGAVVPVSWGSGCMMDRCDCRGGLVDHGGGVLSDRSGVLSELLEQLLCTTVHGSSPPNHGLAALLHST